MLKVVFTALALFGLINCGGGGHAPTPQPVPEPTPVPQPAPVPPVNIMSGVKATTTYVFGSTLGTPGLITYLQNNLPAIKATGFTAIYLQAVWADFDPQPFATPHVYNASAFSNARAVLDLLRANGMKAVIGLNYVGPGYAPNFAPYLTSDKACDWSVTPQVYAAFEQYVKDALPGYDGYQDMLSFMVFTEGAEGCGQATPEAAPAVALQLQTTLGSLPSRLPADLRAKWRIGYHDYSIVNLGWGNGVGPIALPNEFDFVSMVAYNVTTTTELDNRAARFASLYPTAPLFVGEGGNNGCQDQASQAALDAQLVQWALNRGSGFNLWGWANAGPTECTNPVYGGLAITNQDGTPNPAALAIRKVLTGS